MKADGLGIIVLFLIIAVILLSLILSKVKEAKSYNKATVIYTILTGLCIGLTGLTGLLGMIEDMTTLFITVQVLILILGVLHAFLMYKLVPWTSAKKFTWEFLFSFAIALVGSIFFLLVYNLILQLHALQFQILSAMVWFFVPFFFLQAYNRYSMIPARIFRKWYYPVGKIINEPLDNELVSLLVVSFVFHKKMNAPEITTFRAKAPSHMVFGRLFYYFINDYNERHREGPIEFLDQEGKPYGWVFHHKPNWLRIKRHIDPDQVIIDNHIKENSVIICHRIKEL